ncbi:MAG TPA: type II secretion system F family protein [Candidatus Saccharimonadales bacterium]|nr:type II secretion system F family protein [Candidatus Saccharimonadales bacterium]
MNELFGTRNLLKEKMLVTRHLSLMLKSGISPVDSLKTLQEQTKSKQLKIALGGIADSINNGQTLTKSIKKYPKIFDDFYTSVVASGEATGSLNENLAFLAQQLENEYRLKTRIGGALIYPAIILVTLVVVGIIVSVIVFPRLIEFSQAFESVPTSTKFLLNFLGFLSDYGISIIIGLIVLVSLFVILARTILSPWWQSTLLNLPIIRDVVRSSQLERLSRNLGTLLKSGLPVATSIETTAPTLTNKEYRDSLEKIAKLLKSGTSISKSIAKIDNHNLYPPLVTRMIVVGEKSGNLDENLIYLSSFYREEVNDSIRNISTTIEPVLILILGVSVGLFAIALLSPIYNLTYSLSI